MKSNRGHSLFIRENKDSAIFVSLLSLSVRSIKCAHLLRLPPPSCLTAGRVSRHARLYAAVFSFSRGYHTPTPPSTFRSPLGSGPAPFWCRPCRGIVATFPSSRNRHSDPEIAPKLRNFAFFLDYGPPSAPFRGLSSSSKFFIKLQMK